MKITQEEKVTRTVAYAESLMRAGWERQAAITNSRNLHHLSDKRMKEVEQKVKN